MVILIGGPPNESPDEIAALSRNCAFTLVFGRAASVGAATGGRRARAPGSRLVQAIVPSPGMMDVRRPMPMNEQRW